MIATEVADESATQAPTEAPTEPPTEAPTEAPAEPDDSEAYASYLELLEDNQTDITNSYYIHLDSKNDREERGIVDIREPDRGRCAGNGIYILYRD